MSEHYTELARLADIPVGTLYRAEHDDNFYLLANVEGEIFAIDDRCTHEDASLYKGSLQGDCVACPLHGSRFNLRTGEPQEEPAETAVNSYDVRIEAGRILVAIA